MRETERVRERKRKRKRKKEETEKKHPEKQLKRYTKNGTDSESKRRKNMIKRENKIN